MGATLDQLICSFIQCYIIFIIPELSSFLEHFEEFTRCCEFLASGPFWDRLGRLGLSWALFRPNSGLRVPPKLSKSSPRARFSKIGLFLQRGHDFEALRIRRNSRNPERTRAKRLLNRFAHSAGPSCVCCVLSSKKVKEVSWANIFGRCR